MVKYEYKVIEISESNLKENENLLNQLGKEGWEMVTVIQSAFYADTPVFAYLKRRKE